MKLFASLLVVGSCLIFLVGCSKGPKMIPVSGTVTLDGEKVPGPGYIYFNPESNTTEGYLRPGTAEFDAEGNYTAQTFNPGDGLLPGKYFIRIDCWKTPPNMEGKKVESYIHPRYQDPAKSQLELNVDANAKKITYDIKLTSQ